MVLIDTIDTTYPTTSWKGNIMVCEGNKLRSHELFSYPHVNPLESRECIPRIGLPRRTLAIPLHEIAISNRGDSTGCL